MAEQELFRGFFSYTRYDGETDPGLITALTTDLERRINARLVDARFAIWRDTERLKTGERWNDAIDGELRSADVLIVLLTPRWIGSEYCRKEFSVFEELEASRGVGKYVAPVLARPLDQQERRLTPEQRDILGRIRQRQHFEADATDFLKLPRARRNAEIDKIAAHIAGMIEELRDLPRPSTPAAAERLMGRELEPSRADSGLAIGPLTLRTAGTAGDLHRSNLDVFRDAEFAPELVVVPAGEFMLGSTDDEEGGYEDERPRHRVRIAQRFAIGRYPVTFEEYNHFCVKTQRRKPEDEGWGKKRRPVINVSWEDAQAYVGWLSQETGRTYRLPSEAEWEYACRAGTTTRYSFGDAITPEDANYGGSGLSQTSEVGAYPANPWGLHDMHGNVCEWVEDDWHENYRRAPMDGSVWKDPGSSSNPRLCVLRGGSWSSKARVCRSAYRDRYVAGNRVDYIGFRVAGTLS